MAILTYHHIAEVPEGQEGHRGLFVPPALFREQLEWFRRHKYVDLSLEALADALQGGAALPDRWVTITFDDGFRNNLTAGLPALQEFGYSATIFLITDRVARIAPTGAYDDYLTVDDLKELAGAGIRFGSHTCSHPRLTKLENSAALAELTQSRQAMAELGLPTDWFCYPYGNFSPRIAGLVKEAGYRAALSTIRDNRVGADQLHWLPRVMVMNDTTPKRLSYMMSPWYHYVHAWKNRKRWRSLR